MRRTIGALGLMAATGLGLLGGTAQAARSVPAGQTKVQSVQVFKVGDRVKVDVAVSHPDARARKVSRKARNRGTARITLRNAEGAVLATHSARAGLPVVVPRAHEVIQTYRFVLDDPVAAAVAGAGTVQVQTEVESRLDVDGSGGADPATGTDSDTSEVTVDVLEADPVQWQYHEFWFDTGASCDVDHDDCGVFFEVRGDTAFRNTSGRVNITPAAGRTNIRIDGQNDRFLQGFVSSLASERLEITTGSVVPWGLGRVYSAPRADGTAGKVGGPLYLDVEREWTGRHEWHLFGYVAIAGG